LNSKSSQKIFNVKNKTVVLTGSAGRIGEHFAHVLSANGANVILVDIQSQKNKKLQNTLRKLYKTKPLSINADISDELQVKTLVNTILKKFKKIDVLINNAHFLSRIHPKRDTSFEHYPSELWDDMVNQNLRSLFLCSREIGKVMLKQKKGIIVNISSIYGIQGADQRIYGKSRLNSPSPYAITKGGMVNFTRYLASYWQGKNIRVNTLTLGGVFDKKLHSDKSFVKKYSEKTILGRMAEKSDFDGALLFLISDASSYVTGTNLIVDGGWSIW
jgi:NAD(P)-dependent dehydrogenase (short-subunit alcohol dehydrogenase family)